MQDTLLDIFVMQGVLYAFRRNRRYLPTTNGGKLFPSSIHEYTGQTSHLYKEQMGYTVGNEARNDQTLMRRSQLDIYSYTYVAMCNGSKRSIFCIV